MSMLNDSLSIDNPLSTAASSASKTSKDVLPSASNKLPTLDQTNKANATSDSSAKPLARTPSEKQLQGIVDDINSQLSQLNNYMRVKKDEVSGRYVYSFIDAKSEKVIKQFPTEEFLYVSKRLTEYLDAEKAKRSDAPVNQLGNFISNIV